MTIEIVRITAENAELLDRVAVDVFDEAIQPARVKAYVAETSHYLYVAVKNGEVVGQARAVMHRQPDTATELYIDNLGVTPALQRQGIASRLVEALFAVGKARGCDVAWVGTEVDNRPAQGLYEKFGGERDVFALFLTKL